MPLAVVNKSPTMPPAVVKKKKKNAFGIFNEKNQKASFL
jgi:hypothetical protein